MTASSLSAMYGSVHKAMRGGHLSKQPCEACGAEKAIAHHDDYAKPLDVRWLCRSCHRHWHNKNGRGENLPDQKADLFLGSEHPMTKQDRFRLSGETGLHPNTVQKWAKGEKVSTQSAYALAAAAKKLRIEGPQIRDDATGTEG